MGTIKVDTVTGLSTASEVTIASNKFVGTAAGTMTVVGEGGTTQTSLQQGLTKCWVNFDGTASGAASRDTFNVSGMTDSGTGNYVVTFSSNMGNANFSGVAVQGNNNASNPGINATSAVGHTASSASAIETSNLDPASTDYQQISASYNGDLA
jgi:hypothetical protein